MLWAPLNHDCPPISLGMVYQPTYLTSAGVCHGYTTQGQCDFLGVLLSGCRFKTTNKGQAWASPHLPRKPPQLTAIISFLVLPFCRVPSRWPSLSRWCWFPELEPEAQKRAFGNPSRFSESTIQSPLGVDSNPEVKLPSVLCASPKPPLSSSAEALNKFYHLSPPGNNNWFSVLYYAKSPQPQKAAETRTLTLHCRQAPGHTARGRPGKSLLQKRQQTVQTQTCGSSVPAWAPGPAARRAAPSAGSWPGTAWPSAHSSYLRGLAWWRWISGTPPHSPVQKASKNSNGHYWLQRAGRILFMWKKCVPHTLCPDQWKNGQKSFLQDTLIPFLFIKRN